MEEVLDNIQSSIKTNKQKQICLSIDWPYRLIGNLIILSLVFAVSFIIIMIRTDLVQNKIYEISREFYQYTTRLGFTVDDIILEGRAKTSRQEIINILNIDDDTNILELDLNQIKTKIEELPWVKTANIKRSFLPNTLNIKIEEKEVQALWQMSENFYPVDTEGNVINADYTPGQPILLIIGTGAPENLNSLLEIIKQDDSVFQKVKAAIFVSERRWNLILGDIEHGMTIKLPEENIARAWKKLLDLHAAKSLLKRKLTIIDLRLPDKVIVELEKSSPKKVAKESQI